MRGNLTCIIILMIFSGHELIFQFNCQNKLIFFPKANISSPCYILYYRFPNWLDQWLKIRKQLGLLMLFAACIHVSFFFIMYTIQILYSKKIINVVFVLIAQPSSYYATSCSQFHGLHQYYIICALCNDALVLVFNEEKDRYLKLLQVGT